ncbi:YfiR family protein [Undibacterium sp. Ren11W]|uniref:YfiR family protein n=1 Tax=Undibacterium sp. Ren11W TaxID=3413045 RepID=UPI003BF3FEE7
MGSRLLAGLTIALALLLPAMSLCAQENTANNEYAVKAAFVYNFALYTEWPVVPLTTYNFCILGKDPFGARFDALALKTLQGKAIQIHRIASSHDVKSCHLLFVPAREQENYQRGASTLSQQAILTITDATQVDERWPMIMISLVAEGERYTFDINQAAAKLVGLTFSSKLLRLARSVR